ncbi:hypothetical protein A2U01_0103813, partial [Trifolium medium]|nr:hypothetical protein [Trifolium medium]
VSYPIFSKIDVSPYPIPVSVCLCFIDQSLVGPVVIDVGLGGEDHGSILCNCDREEAETT